MKQRNDSRPAHSRATWWILGFALAALLFQATLLEPGAPWITDNGNRYLVMRNLIDHGTAAMENPAAALDPENRFFPDGLFHFQHHRGEILSVYSDIFPRLSAPFYRGFGEAGLFFWPIAGTLLTLMLTLMLWRPARLPGDRQLLLAAALLFGTPLLFYSGVFWEMTLSLVLPLAALLLGRAGRYLPAGIVLGCGLWLREECYFIAAAAGAVLAFDIRKNPRPLLGFAAGFLLAALPVWTVQFLQFGHPLGLHGSLYYSHNASGEAPSWWKRFTGCLDGYWIYLLRFEPAGAGRWYLTLPAAALAAAGAFRGGRRWKVWLLGCALAMWGWFLVEFFRTSPADVTEGLAVGFLCASPLLAGAMVSWRELATLRNPQIRFAMRFALIYLLLVPPLLTRSDIGVIWGARHFLILYPMLLLPGWIALRRMGRFWFPAFLLAAFLLQAAGERQLIHGNLRALQYTTALRRSTPETVISDVFFLPELAPQTFFEKKWLFVKSDEDLDAALDRLREAGIREFTLVLSPVFSRLSLDARQRLVREAPPVSPVLTIPAGAENDRMAVLITVCRLQ